MESRRQKLLLPTLHVTAMTIKTTRKKVHDFDASGNNAVRVGFQGFQGFQGSQLQVLGVSVCSPPHVPF
jgi:hypothetical protein